MVVGEYVFVLRRIWPSGTGVLKRNFGGNSGRDGRVANITKLRRRDNGKIRARSPVLAYADLSNGTPSTLRSRTSPSRFTGGGVIFRNLVVNRIRFDRAAYTLIEISNLRAHPSDVRYTSL